MIVAASVTSLLSMYLGIVLRSGTVLNKVAKSSMWVTFIIAFALLMVALGYMRADQLVQDVAVGISCASLLFVGTLLNTKGILLLIIAKMMCFTVTALLVFNTLLAHGVVQLA
jgi:hypothetical protein